MAESVIEMVQRLKYGNAHQALVVDTPDSERTVFEVPALLRAKSPASFENKGLQLGLHHRTLKGSETEVFKFELAQIVHSQLAKLRKSSWDRFAQVVVGDVSIARRAYSASSARFTDEEIQHLLALDALFLVVLFKYVNGGGLFWNEFEASIPRLKNLLLLIDKTDFFLIENQVPMYLLQSVVTELCKIDEKTQARRNVDPSFSLEMKVEDELEMILNEAVLNLNPFTFPTITKNTTSYACLSGALCFQRPSKKSRDGLHEHLISTYPVAPLVQKSLINCQHLLDCLYTVICGHLLPFRVEQGVESNLALESIPSATRLETVGICVIGSVPSLRDVRLSGQGYIRSAKLQLPKVALYDFSESAFQNLALHEQVTSGGYCGDLRCYLQCMASLCVDHADVQVLSERGVINNHMGNDIIVGMWDRTLRGIYTPFPSSAWVRMYDDIHRHRKARLKRWRQECWALFFAKPWTLVSVLTGIIFLFLTATQTYFTAFPPKR